MPTAAVEALPAGVIVRRKETRQEKRLTMETSVMKVTPAMATKWLEETEQIPWLRNRNIADGKVHLYAENMVRGSWEISHQGLALYEWESKNGILDGQHRLWAVIKANVPVFMQVTRYSGGNPDDAVEVMKTFDRGQSRTIGQVLNIEHGTTRAATRAAVVRYLLIFLKGGGRADSHVIRSITDSDIIDGVHRYEKDLDWFCSLKRGSGNTFLSAPIAAALVYAHSITEFESDVASLGNQLSGGEGLYEGDPALTFRDWILKEGSDNLLRRPETRMKLMKIAFKVIQASIQGKKVRQLREDMTGFEFFREAKSGRTTTGKSN